MKTIIKYRYFFIEIIKKNIKILKNETMNLRQNALK